MPETYKRLQCGEEKAGREGERGALQGIGNGVSVYSQNIQSPALIRSQPLLSFRCGSTSSKVSRQKTSRMLSQARGDGRSLQDCQAERAFTGISHQDWLQAAKEMWSRAAGEGQALPLHLPQHSSYQELSPSTLPWKCCCQGSGDAFRYSEIKIRDSPKHSDKK